MRIGEVAKRTSVPPATLRVWERRYGVLQPERTPGGHRRYTTADVRRIRQLVERVRDGVTISAAAAEVLGAESDLVEEHDEERLRSELWAAMDALDPGATRFLVSGALQRRPALATLDAVLVPLLHRLGDDWRASSRSIAREHVITTVVRSLLVEHLAATVPDGPVCLAFAPEGERHDVGLIMAAIALSEAGWRPVVLGADTPWTSVEALVDELAPELVVIGGQTRRPAIRLLAHWSRHRARHLVLGGAGFRSDDGASIGAHVHHGSYDDLVGVIVNL
ncbi:MAG: MerR family transcriptional regulator [Acidimicrobiales bacterium]